MGPMCHWWHLASLWLPSARHGLEGGAKLFPVVAPDKTWSSVHKQICMMLHLHTQKLSSYCDGGQTLEQFPQRGKESAWAEIHNTQLDTAQAAAGAAELGWVISRGLFQHLWFCASVTLSLYLFTSCHTTPSQSKYLFHLLLDADGQIKRFFLSHPSAASAGSVSTGLVLLINFKAVLIHKLH